MGADSSKQQAPKAVPPPGLRVFRNGPVADHPVTLRLQEKMWSLSGDSFAITDVHTKQPVFKIKGSALSFRETKTFSDVRGNDILTMKENVISLHNTQRIFDPTVSKSEPIFEIKAKITFVKGKMQATVKNIADGKTLLITLKASMRAKFGMIYIGDEKTGGQPIAQIYRPTTAQSLFLENHEYLVQVAAGVDLGLILAFCVALDELMKDDN